MSDFKPDAREAVEAEHERLKEIMSDLIAQAGASSPNGELAVWRRRLLGSLRMFQRSLLTHFELEEDGGFFSGIIRIAPEQFNRVRALEAGHSSIIEELDQFVRFVENPPRNPKAVVSEIRARLSRLVETVRAHEGAECELIQDAYYQDYGVGG